MENQREIIIDDGTREFILKNNFDEVFAVIRFNPSDIGMIERFDEVVKYLDSIEIDETSNDADYMAQKIIEINAGIKEKYDYLCGCRISDRMFQRYQPLSVFGNGDFFCEIILEHISKLADESIKSRLTQKKAKIKKLTAKNRYQ